MPLFIISFLISGSVFAKTFSNSYVTFNLPNNWVCKLNETEWVCNNRIKTNKKGGAEAVIILTAKEIGPSDSLELYETYLRTSKKIKLKSGKIIQSKVMRVKKQRINNHYWIDGLHRNSEVNKFYTRYLATVKPPVAVLVTFSAHYKHYTKYSKDFFTAIKSLRVTALKKMLSKQTQHVSKLGTGAETLGIQSGGGLSGLKGEFQDTEDNDSPDILLILFLVLLIGMIYYGYKKFKK